MSCWDQSCTDHRILCLQTPTSWSRHCDFPRIQPFIERLGSWALFEQAPAGSAIYIFSEERWRQCSLVTWCSEFRCKEELCFVTCSHVVGTSFSSFPNLFHSKSTKEQFNSLQQKKLLFCGPPYLPLGQLSLAPHPYNPPDTSRWRFSRTRMAKMWGESIPMGDSWWYLGSHPYPVPDDPGPSSDINHPGVFRTWWVFGKQTI